MPDNSYPTREFSNTELKVSSWLVSHRDAFNKVLYGSLIVVDAIFIGLFLWQVVDYARTYAATEKALSESTRSLLDWNSLRVALAPDPIRIESAELLNTGTATDFLGRIANPNDDRYALFEYRFVWQGGNTTWLPSFILPQQSKFVASLGVEDIAPLSAQIEITNIRWKRVTEEDRLLLESTRDGLVVVSTAFIPNINEGFTGSAPVSSADFVVENRSPFDLQDAAFIVVLRSGPSLVAVNTVTVPRIDRGEQRLVRVRWFSFIPVGTVVVEPDINYLDSSHIASRIIETFETDEAF